MNEINQPNHNEMKEPSQMEQEINHTRERIGRTVEALEERLSPGQLMDQALGFARDHGGDFATGVASSVRRNPLPVIVTGLGILWLLKSQMSQRNQDAVPARGRIYTPYDEHDPTYPGASPWVDPNSDLGNGSSAGSVRGRRFREAVGRGRSNQVAGIECAQQRLGGGRLRGGLPAGGP